MADLYFDPVKYGINDVRISDGADFRARIYYPSTEGSVFDVQVRPGRYPLVAFAHGQREGGGTDGGGVLGATPGCPADITQDYRRWGAVLHLLARCGFVVVAPALHDVIFSSEAAAARIEAAINWTRTRWQHRSVIHQPPVIYLDPDVSEYQEAAKVPADEQRGLGRFGVTDLGLGIGFDITDALSSPTELGLVGHSWGARACARVAVRGNVRVRALASVAGSWDENEAIQALITARVPTLLVAGTADLQNLSYLKGLWNGLVSPKHQAALQGVGHWDWFGTDGGIQYCDAENRHQCRSRAWSTASEMLVGLMTRYLRHQATAVPAHLLGDRYPASSWWDFTGSVLSKACAVKARWDDPFNIPPYGKTGNETWGLWVDQFNW